VKVKRRKDKSGKYIDASQTILPLRYSQTIGRELFEKASKIRDYIIMANEIKVISQINFNKRYEYQEEAKRLIVSMMDKIDQSFILINYNANAHKEWSKLCYDLLKSVRGWQAADLKRFSNKS